MERSLKVFSVRNADRGSVLATNAHLASSYWARFWGLMFRRQVEDGGGILLTKSSQWWFAFGGRGAHDTLELPAGVAERSGTVRGDTLVFESPGEQAAA
jgi:uncharacterized membrane protein (UPF0127 family)